MSYTINGRCISVSETVVIGAKETPKRTLVLNENSNGEYPVTIAFDVFGKDTVDLQDYQGKDISVDFVVRSNQSKTDETRWFTSAKIVGVKMIDAPMNTGCNEDNDPDLEEEVPF